MIHYTCDRCKRQIDTDEQNRFIVHIEIQSAIDGPSIEIDDDIDQLNELNDFLENLHDESVEDVSDLVDSQLSHEGRYDLCAECHHQFLKNPLGRDAMLTLGFSNN
ncbi:hypothetical protein K227x_13940 [Rubripirellula lacrimiformis]|uniref:Uncharacterized protein n=1 Tax=Rubripirellula lacrimiformis TaxID=1930273 RepID=A0A517N7B0_9BACT|nr:hypothetical protein [Rubripirellula lacrimiformis]QDT03015.1 hypothetical protein K227x_13940 [Rubripirellula lacrimiformis]